MGFRSALKGGGLFTGDGTLGQFVFSAIAPGEKKAGKWAYIVLAFKADGKEKEDTQHLFLGGAKQYQFEEGGTEAISVDEKTGEPTPKSRIGKKTPAGLFFRTLYAAADAADTDLDSVLPDIDAGEALDFSAIAGARVSLGQEVDVKATADLGKRKGSDGNEYDRTNTTVESFYSLGEGGGGAKSGGKPAAGKAKGGKKEDTSIRDAADAVVLGLIADAQKADKKNKTGETPVSKFKMAVLRNTDIAKGDKDAVQKLLASDDYKTDAVERGVFAYDEEGETVAAA
jgi:hypothetical protein